MFSRLLILTVSAAVGDFLDHHPAHPVQPIAYTHKVHLANGCNAAFVMWVSIGARCAHSRCDRLHELSPGDRYRPSRDQEDCRLQGRGEEIPWVRVYNYSADRARAVQSRAAHSCRRACALPRRYDQTDHGRTQSEFEYGFLPQLSHAEEGLGRLPDVPLLRIMERRDFIKISALTGVRPHSKRVAARRSSSSVSFRRRSWFPASPHGSRASAPFAPPAAACWCG